MKKIIYASLFAIAALVPGCSDPDTARRVAEDHGFTQVEVTGHRFTGCGEHDDTSTGFTAVGVNGRPVTGVVCGSWSPFGKSSTLRLD